MNAFPPNSKSTENREPIQRVTSENAVRRRKPLGKQFRETFFGGNAQTAFRYGFSNVIIPGIQSIIVDVVQTSIERIVYGDRKGRSPRHPLGRVDYRSYSQPQRTPPWRDDRPPMPTAYSSRATRARRGFDEIIIQTRQEAEDVLDRLYDILSKYESVSVAELYELTGLGSDHTDHKWGWTDLQGASARRVRSGGYLLDLPEPEYLE